MKHPKVDSEFKSVIPPLSSQEFDQLEDNILSEGIRNPLVTWRGLLLDGHNRLAIAKRHGLPYDTVEVDLPNRDAAMLWIVRNQLGRRNLTPQQMSYLRGKWYEREKLAPHRPEKVGQNDPLIERTSQRIAEQTGVSEATVRRDAKFAQSVDRIAELAGEDKREAVLSGEARMSKKDVEEVASTPDITPEMIDDITEGRRTVAEVKREIDHAKYGNARQDVAVTVFSSETNEYYTPPEYINAARRVMGSIDLDPASCEAAQRNVNAGMYFTESDDGLSRGWTGNVWLNPPYGKVGNESSQGVWAEYLIKQHLQGSVESGVLLVKAAVGYEWFERLWDRLPVCFARNRISFIKSDGSDDGQSKQGTAFFYVGDDIESFVREFSVFGRIILPENQL